MSDSPASATLRGPSPDGDKSFLADFDAMSAFGATAGGGIERHAGSPEDAAVRDWLTSWLVERGFRVELDAVGNLYGLYELVPGAPYIGIGSHLDSQPLGGRYDGAYGVLAAAHAADRIRRHVDANGADGVEFNLAVIDWFNEEGARFGPSMMGSAVATGKLASEAAHATRDTEGRTVREALEETGYLGDSDAPRFAAYAEIHVEQGRRLEDMGITIGLVESTWAADKREVVITGAQSHTGSTIIADRRDALAAAARLIVAARVYAETHQSEPAVHVSVSELYVLPNSPVVVPREVRMNLDVRSSSASAVAEAIKSLTEEAARIATADRVDIALRRTHAWGRQPYPEAGVELARDAASALGLTHVQMQTIAGHDSTNMNDIVPTVMLFVPSVEGIAHNESEYTHPQDCLDGVDLLTEVVARLAHGESASR